MRKLELRRHVGDATALLEPYGGTAATLSATARFVANRMS